MRTTGQVAVQKKEIGGIVELFESLAEQIILDVGKVRFGKIELGAVIGLVVDEDSICFNLIYVLRFNLLAGGQEGAREGEAMQNVYVVSGALQMLFGAGDVARVDFDRIEFRIVNAGGGQCLGD